MPVVVCVSRVSKDCHFYAAQTGVAASESPPLSCDLYGLARGTVIPLEGLNRLHFSGTQSLCESNWPGFHQL